MRNRLVELLSRFGLRRVPTPVIAATAIVCTGLAISGFARWGGGSNVRVAVSEPPVASEEPSVPAPCSAAPTEAPEPVAMVVVHIVGAVLRPGVYEVESGSRVADVLALAGGLTGNAAECAVNLARVVSDGEQVFVPTTDEWTVEGAVALAPGGGAASGGAASTPAPSTPAGPINVNTADAATLETLPGIGPATAAKIISDRQANGPYRTIDDLLRVSGIGEKKLAGIRDLVTVG